MDEEINIIDTKTRNEKIKDFLISNKKSFISIFILSIITIFSFYIFQIYQEIHKKELSDKYNSALAMFKSNEKNKSVLVLKDVIEDKDSTYSPLALYFLIDNNLINEKNEINKLFNILIEKTSLEHEIKNLIIYKKALYNADDINENELLNILKPILNSDSVWKSHSLYLIAEYFYSKGEQQKSKEFFEQIINTQNVNQSILKEAKKRLNRDLSE